MKVKKNLQEQLEVLQAEHDNLIQMMSTLMANTSTNDFSELVMPIVYNVRMMQSCLNDAKEVAAKLGDV